jgi:hypothetical protein
VYSALGRPPFSTMRQAAQHLGDAARAIRQCNTAEVQRETERLRALDLQPIVDAALERVTQSAPRLSPTLSLRPIREASVEGAVEALDDSDPYIVSQVARARLERANRRHEETLRILARTLESHGLVVERSRLIDAFARLKTGPAIFEVKSTTPENERSQCRHALSQLYEYRYLHSIPDASLWVVLSDSPQLAWLADYLQTDRGVNVLWVEDSSLAGPAVQFLFESGSAERRRAKRA